jgi:hypothetical protein
MANLFDGQFIFGPFINVIKDHKNGEKERCADLVHRFYLILIRTVYFLMRVLI